MSQAARELTELLGDGVPATVLAQDPEVLLRLAEQVRAARRQQSVEVSAAIDKAVSGVPLPVRGIVKRAVLG